jgi:hypothetical protein
VIRSRDKRLLIAGAILAVIVMGMAPQSLAQAGAKEPVPPRTGQYSVQLIIGHTDDVILNIIPPRLYTDGTPIPMGSPCTIVIYRSKAKGAPGTYTEEVGRAEGTVTSPDDMQPWIVVRANAGPEDPLSDTIYLACTAIVDGVESARNNQWLTINWHPQGIPEWDVIESPGGAGVAGPGAFTPCANYMGPIEPTGNAGAGPMQQPGKYMLVYAEVPRSADPASGNSTNWNWTGYGPVDLKGGKRYFLVFGRLPDPKLFEEQNLPIGEELVTVTQDTAIIWDANEATSGKRYAYCFQPAAGPVTSAGSIDTSIILLFDASGSMADDSKIDSAKAAAKTFLTTQIQARDEVALIVFYDCSSIVIEQPFTTDTSALISKIEGIQPTGSTPLYGAVSFAKDYMKQNASGARKKIIQFTDGLETCGGGP